MIRTLEQMEQKVLALKNKHRVVVAWAQDSNTIGAINYAVKKGLIEAILVGRNPKSKKHARQKELMKVNLFWLKLTMRRMLLLKQFDW